MLRIVWRKTKGAAWIVCFSFDEGLVGRVDEVTFLPNLTLDTFAMNVRSQALFFFFALAFSCLFKRFAKLPNCSTPNNVTFFQSKTLVNRIRRWQFSSTKFCEKNPSGPGAIKVDIDFVELLQELRNRSLHFECREVAGGENEINKLPRLKR